MTLPIIVYPTALLSALSFSAATLPLWRKWCFRVGLVDDPGERKIHDASIPLAGGLAVFTGIVVPIFFAGLFLFLSGSFSHSLGSASAEPTVIGSKDFMYYL